MPTSSTYTIPDKAKTLYNVIQEIEKDYGDCNDRIKKFIDQINLVYASPHQKIIENYFSGQEKEEFYKSIKPRYLDIYNQLYKLLYEIHQQRQATVDEYQANGIIPKNFYEYFETRQQNLSDLLTKYKTILDHD